MNVSFEKMFIDSRDAVIHWHSARLGQSHVRKRLNGDDGLLFQRARYCQWSDISEFIRK